MAGHAGRAEVSGNAVLWLNGVLSGQISVHMSGCVAVGVYLLSDSLVNTRVVRTDPWFLIS